MGSKLAAVFLMCIIVGVQKVSGYDGDSFEARFTECSKICKSECQSQGHGYYLCEMKCDGECGAKEAAAKLGIDLGND